MKLAGMLYNEVIFLDALLYSHLQVSIMSQADSWIQNFSIWLYPDVA